MKELRTITAQELMEALEDIPSHAKVAFTSDYGDRHHTEQIIPITGEMNPHAIRESAYSESGLALDGEGNDVWIIS